MNALESQIHYPLGDALPEPGGAIELAPGLKWLRMRLPFALDHINLWLLRDHWRGRDGWAVVDTGIADDLTQGTWEQVFANALDGLPVLRVIVTHMHPDHIGLAHWLTERWSGHGHRCELWMSACDYQAATIACNVSAGFGGGFGEAAAAHFEQHGARSHDVLRRIRARAGYFASMVPAVPASFHRLLDGQVLTIGAHRWRCHVGHGHSPEHMALHCAELAGGVLIAGDMVLPRISTNVMVTHTEPEADPLRLFLDSIERLRALPADTLVLPSHGKPFGGRDGAAGGLHTRIDQLHAHHAERLAEVLAACTAAPMNATELLPVLFKRTLDVHQTSFALGESIAHLHTLWFEGLLHRTLADDGTYRFEAVTAIAPPAR